MRGERGGPQICFGSKFVDSPSGRWETAVAVRRGGTQRRDIGRVVWLLAALVLLMSPVALAKGAKHLTVIYKLHAGSVQPGTVGGADLRCPARAPYGVGGIFSPGSSVGYTELAVAQSGALRHGWVDSLVDLAPGPEPFEAGAVCSSRNFAPYASPITLQPGQTTGYTVICPKIDPKPVSGGAFAANGSAGDVILAESYPVPREHGWATELANHSAQAQQYEITTECAPSAQRVIYLSSANHTLGSHKASGASGHCPRHAPYPVAGSFSPALGTPAGDIALTASSPLGLKRGDWLTEVVNLTGQAQGFQVGTVCIG
jgi:hypothetical protein